MFALRSFVYDRRSLPSAIPYLEDDNRDVEMFRSLSKREPADPPTVPWKRRLNKALDVPGHFSVFQRFISPVVWLPHCFPLSVDVSHLVNDFSMQSTTQFVNPWFNLLD